MGHRPGPGHLFVDMILKQIVPQNQALYFFPPKPFGGSVSQLISAEYDSEDSKTARQQNIVWATSVLDEDLSEQILLQ